jgi:GDP-D-mannose dehydratase
MKKEVVTCITVREGAYLAESLLRKGYEVHQFSSHGGRSQLVSAEKGRPRKRVTTNGR